MTYRRSERAECFGVLRRDDELADAVDREDSEDAADQHPDPAGDGAADDRGRADVARADGQFVRTA